MSTRPKHYKPRSAETAARVKELYAAKAKKALASKEPKVRKKRAPMTDATKLKMSLAKKGFKTGPLSEETKAKMSLARKGKKHSKPRTPEHCERIRQALLGKKHTPERCANIAAGHARNSKAKHDCS